MRLRVRLWWFDRFDVLAPLLTVISAVPVDGPPVLLDLVLLRPLAGVDLALVVAGNRSDAFRRRPWRKLRPRSPRRGPVGLPQRPKDLPRQQNQAARHGRQHPVLDPHQ